MGFMLFIKKNGKLYYVGRASNMKRRFYDHLRNNHSKKWDYFSVYFTNNEQRAKELESIIISIVDVEKLLGNKQKPRIRTQDKEMRKRIQKKMDTIDKEKSNKRFAGSMRNSKKKSPQSSTIKRLKEPNS